MIARIVLCALCCLPAFAVCETEQERLTWVRERLRADAPKDQLEQLLRFLEIGTRNPECKKSGDLWYYRGVLEEKLGKARDASFSKKQAKDLRSLAEQRHSDPFTSAARLEQDRTVPPFVREKWALVIGVGTFTDKAIPPLRYTTKDAKDFEAMLLNPNLGRFKRSNVQLLLDDKASLRGIRMGIDWLRQNAQKEDLVVIYMSSHGSPKSMDKLGVSYIITHDTDRESPYATSYQMVDLVEDLNRDIQARRLVLILDACHSGGATELQARSFEAEEPAEAFSPALHALRNGVGRAILTASRADQQSWESPKLDDGRGNGYFTYYLLETLRETGGLGQLTEIYAKTREKVRKATSAEGKSQDPVLSVSEKAGEIILGVSPKPVASSSRSPVLRLAKAR